MRPKIDLDRLGAIEAAAQEARSAYLTASRKLMDLQRDRADLAAARHAKITSGDLASNGRLRRGAGLPSMPPGMSQEQLMKVAAQTGHGPGDLLAGLDAQLAEADRAILAQRMRLRGLAERQQAALTLASACAKYARGDSERVIQPGGDHA